MVIQGLGGQLRMLRIALAVVAAIALIAASPAVASAGGPGTWTKLSTGEVPIANTAALFRTSDGILHVIWMKYGRGKVTYVHSAVSPKGQKVGKVATVLAWKSLLFDPQLVAQGNGMRLIFSGQRNAKPSDPYRAGNMYTATAFQAGTGWKLSEGSIGRRPKASLSTGAGGATELDGTPVAGWSMTSDLWWHIGADPDNPASASDHHLRISGGNPALAGAQLAIDAGDGTLVMAYANTASGGAGLYAVPVVPSPGTTRKAPASGTPAHPPAVSGDVALTGRTGAPGTFLAYCNTPPRCRSVGLWRTGTSKVVSIPKSKGPVDTIDAAAGPDGSVWVVWHRSDTNKLYVARTNPSVTKFGTPAILSPPKGTLVVFRIAAEGSRKRLDIVLNALDAHGHESQWHTQAAARG
jgi:hypothetical protein